jgi:hypothetical protein
MRRPLGLAAGWSVAKACTTPYLGHVDDDRIEFGEAQAADYIESLSCWWGVL